MTKVQIHEIHIDQSDYRAQEAGCRTIIRPADQTINVGDWLHFREFDAKNPTGRHLAVRVLSKAPGPQSGWMTLATGEPEYVDGSCIHWPQACGCVWGSNIVNGDVTWSTIVRCPSHTRATFTQKVEA